MLTTDDVQKIKEALKGDFTIIRTDIQEVRADIANHDQKFEEITESINELRADMSIQQTLERIKSILREKLHAEI